MAFERDNVRRMAGYVYGEQTAAAGIVKLNTNENPYPPSPAVARALADFDAARLRRYPDPQADALREQVAEHLGVAAQQVVATNGGDEGLRLAMSTFVDPGAAFGMAEPSYSLYPVLAAVQDCRLQALPLGEDWRPPGDFAARMNAADARLVCLVNPHAPSGTLLDADAVSRLAGQLRGVLLVDEAYVDFVDPALGYDLTPLLRAHPNLLLLRTLSKGYSLAGLRVGFLIGAADLVGPIRDKTRDSYNVDAIAQALGAAACADIGHARRTWDAVRAERRRVTERLRALGFGVADSQANFVLCQLPDAIRALERLRARGILVRHFGAPRLRDALRISIGRPQENDALLAELAVHASRN